MMIGNKALQRKFMLVIIASMSLVLFHAVLYSTQRSIRIVSDEYRQHARNEVTKSRSPLNENETNRDSQFKGNSTNMKADYAQIPTDLHDALKDADFLKYERPLKPADDILDPDVLDLFADDKNIDTNEQEKFQRNFRQDTLFHEKVDKYSSTETNNSKASENLEEMKNFYPAPGDDSVPFEGDSLRPMVNEQSVANNHIVDANSVSENSMTLGSRAASGNKEPITPEADDSSVPQFDNGKHRIPTAQAHAFSADDIGSSHLHMSSTTAKDKVTTTSINNIPSNDVSRLPAKTKYNNNIISESQTGHRLTNEQEDFLTTPGNEYQLGAIQSRLSENHTKHKYNKHHSLSDFSNLKQTGVLLSKHKTSHDRRPAIVEQNRNPDAAPGFTAVVLLTYMRSGSSLTGDILQQDPDVFYIYEPFKNLDMAERKGGPVTFLNGTVLAAGQYNRSVVLREAMLGWLTCDLSRIFAQSLADAYFMSFSRKARELADCITTTRLGRVFRKNPEYTFRNMKFRRCLLHLRQTCLQSKFRVIKTIRASMVDTLQTLNSIEDSKVLHLVRDPRPTIDSKRKRGMCSKSHGGMETCIEKHCQRQREDTILRHQAEIAQPSRFRVVFYEDLAIRPLKTAKYMYDFIGLSFTNTVAEYVYNVTLGEDKTGCKVCQQKWQIGQSNASSESHVTDWKRNMLPSNIALTQDLCKDVIEMYGYEHFNVSKLGE